MATGSEDEKAEPVPCRAGSVWTTEDTAELLDGLRNGVALDALAERLQRSEKALQARCKNMLPPELRTTVLRADADLVLREKLAAEPDFDPEATLDRNTGRTWNRERDEILRHGWEHRTPLPELVDTVSAPEISIARRLIQLGLALDSLAVAERLGCTPSGVLDVRCRMMRDRAAASVWVLIIDGLPGGLHVSLHASRGDARDYFAAALPVSASSDEITATLAERALGSPHGITEILPGLGDCNFIGVTPEV